MEMLTHPYSPEETDGSPRWIIAMDRLCVKQHAASHQTAGHGPGAVELWHGLYPLVWPHHGRHVLGLAAQRAARQSRTALVRMVPGCQQLGRPVCGPGRLRGLSRLRHPSRLDYLAGRKETRLAPRVVAHAAAAAPSHPARLDRAGSGRRRLVRGLGWPPFLRINQGCTFRPLGYAQFVWLSDLVDQIGPRWRGAGTAFASRSSRVDCTLLAWWGDGHTEPWFVLTDLAPDGCDAQWYGLRSWCEQVFNCTKRGGWQWQQTQMTDPSRVARLWLAMAVATLWMITLGSDMELGPADSAPDLPDLRPLLGLSGTRRPRRLRLFRLGWLWLLVQLIEGQPLPVPRRLVPEPWPDIPERLDLPIQHQKALAYAYM